MVWDCGLTPVVCMDKTLWCNVHVCVCVCVCARVCVCVCFTQHTSSEEEGQALFHRCKELAGTGGGGACCEVLANMLLCCSLCNYPFSPSVELQQFCGEVAEGSGAGGRAARLCHAAVLLVGSSKLREALKMVDGEEEGERPSYRYYCSGYCSYVVPYPPLCVCLCRRAGGPV